MTRLPSVFLVCALLTVALNNVLHRRRLVQESLHLDPGHHPVRDTLSGRHRSSSLHLGSP